MEPTVEMCIRVLHEPIGRLEAYPFILIPYPCIYFVVSIGRQKIQAGSFVYPRRKILNYDVGLLEPIAD